MSAKAIRQIMLLREALQEILDHYPSAYSSARRIALKALDAVPEPEGPTQEEIDAAKASLVEMIRALDEEK